MQDLSRLPGKLGEVFAEKIEKSGTSKAQGRYIIDNENGFMTTDFSKRSTKTVWRGGAHKGPASTAKGGTQHFVSEVAGETQFVRCSTVVNIP
jgi:hypothetical protein